MPRRHTEGQFLIVTLMSDRLQTPSDVASEKEPRCIGQKVTPKPAPTQR